MVFESGLFRRGKVLLALGLLFSRTSPLCAMMESRDWDVLLSIVKQERYNLTPLFVT